MQRKPSTQFFFLSSLVFPNDYTYWQTAGWPFLPNTLRGEDVVRELMATDSFKVYHEVDHFYTKVVSFLASLRSLYLLLCRQHLLRKYCNISILVWLILFGGVNISSEFLESFGGKFNWMWTESTTNEQTLLLLIFYKLCSNKTFHKYTVC